MSADLNPVLTTLCIGRFNRPSILTSLGGLRVRDLIGSSEEEFVASMVDSDKFMGRVFWRKVVAAKILPALAAWDVIQIARNEVERSRKALVDALKADETL